MNADDLQSLIHNIEQQKKNLDKLDANIAQIYAQKCKKTPADLLKLMKEGGWLTAKEALQWGFVDELTDYEDETAPTLNNNTLQALANAGIPIPTLPKARLSRCLAFQPLKWLAIPIRCLWHPFLLNELRQLIIHRFLRLASLQLSCELFSIPLQREIKKRAL